MRRKIVQLSLLTLFFLLTSLIHLWPILSDPLHKAPYFSNGDVKLGMAILNSHLKNLTLLRFDLLYHLPFLYPLSFTVAAGTNLFGQAVLALPIYLLFTKNIILINNLLIILSYILMGLSAFYLFRYFSNSFSAALISATLFQLVNFKIHHLPHLNLLYHFPMALMLLFLLRFLNTTKVRDLLFFLFFAYLQTIFDISLSFYSFFSLGVFYIFYLALRKAIDWRELFLLLIGGVILALILFFTFFYYLQLPIKFNFSTPQVEIAAYPSFNFFSSWNYLTLKLNRLILLSSSFYQGMIISSIFALSYLPFLKRKIEKICWWSLLLSLTICYILILFSFKIVPLHTFFLISDLFLILFAISFALLLFFLRNRLPRLLKIASWTLLILIIASFEPFVKWFNLFQSLGSIFPFLSRNRCVRLSFFIYLLFYLIATGGFNLVFRKIKKHKPLIIGVLLLLIAVEKWRWPIKVEALNYFSSEIYQAYSTLKTLPKSDALLELPFFDDPYQNSFSFLTTFHEQPTYDGGLGYSTDPLELREIIALRKDYGFSFLTDQSQLDHLWNHGLKIIVIHKRFLNESHRSHTLLNIRRATNSGMLKKIFSNKKVIILKINDHFTNQKKIIFPYYFLKKYRLLTFNFNFRNNQNQTVKLELLINGIKKINILFSPQNPQFKLNLSTIEPSLSHLEQVDLSSPVEFSCEYQFF